jgi:hypothetical protein
LNPRNRVYPLRRIVDHWYAGHSMWNILASKIVASIAMISTSKLSENMKSGKREPRRLDFLGQEQSLIVRHVSCHEIHSHEYKKKKAMRQITVTFHFGGFDAQYQHHEHSVL